MIKTVKNACCVVRMRRFLSILVAINFICSVYLICAKFEISKQKISVNKNRRIRTKIAM